MSQGSNATTTAATIVDTNANCGMGLLNGGFLSTNESSGGGPPIKSCSAGAFTSEAWKAYEQRLIEGRQHETINKVPRGQ